MIQTEKVKESEMKASYELSPVRVCARTRKKLDQLLARINRKEYGKKVRPDKLISLSLDLIKDEHIKALRDSSLTNGDRFELMYKRYLVSHRNISKDAFLGMVLEGRNVTGLKEKT